MKIIRRNKRFSSHTETHPETARILRRWPWLTTRTVRGDDGLLCIEYTRRADVT